MKLSDFNFKTIKKTKLRPGFRVDEVKEMDNGVIINKLTRKGIKPRFELEYVMKDGDYFTEKKTFWTIDEAEIFAKSIR
jgi:hypothetical protein